MPALMLPDVTIAGSGDNARNLYHEGPKDVPLTFVSPNARQLQTLQEEGVAAGRSVTTIQGRIEEVMPRTTGPLIFTIDAPRSLATATNTAAREDRDVLIYWMLQPWLGPLIGLALWFASSEKAMKERFARFADRVGDVTAASGSEALFGPTAPPANHLTRPLIRQWMANHAQATMEKVAWGLPPNDAPMQSSIDGTPMRFVVIESPDRWRTPEEIAPAVIEQQQMPILPGDRFLVGETGPTGVRFHPARLRSDRGRPLDQRISVHGTSAMDLESVAAAMRAAEQQESNKMQPMRASD